MVSLHLLCLLLIVCSTQGAGVSAHLIDKRPDCFKSCSHDVECTIKISDTMCSYVDVHDQAKGGDTNIAGRIWNLTMKTSTDEKYRYVDLEWGAPDDGSYNFLTGFLLSISTVNLDSDKFLTPQLECFNLDLGNWTAPHRQLLATRSYGAQFFFNCLRLSRNISREVTVIMHSQPISEKLPKLVQKSFKVPSALEDQYTTYFDHKQIGLLHVIIHKHKKLTDQFQAVLHERQYPSIVRFKQILPLVYNKSEKLMVEEKDDTIHFMIPGLKSLTEYNLYLSYIDSNHTIKELMTVLTINTPEFKTEKEIDDNRLIIITGCCLTFTFLALVICVIWRVRVWGKLKLWLNTSAKNRTNNNKQGEPRILPIYCNENANFVKAVESHVSLLCRFVDVLCINEQSALRCFICGSSTNDHSWVDTQIKDSEVLIYLSPRLGQLLRGEIEAAQISHLDTLCMQSINSLREHQGLGHGSLPHMVTFDCFQQAELDCVHEFKNILSGNHSAELAGPIKLASLGPDGWQLENLDILLFRLYRLSQLPQNFSQSFSGWRQSDQASYVVRYLELFTKSSSLENLATNVLLDQGISFETVHNSSLDMFTERHPARAASSPPSYPARGANSGGGFREDPVEEEEQEVTSDMPLMSLSSGFISAPYSHDDPHSVGYPAHPQGLRYPTQPADDLHSVGYPTHPADLRYPAQPGDAYPSDPHSNRYSPKLSDISIDQNPLQMPSMKNCSTEPETTSITGGLSNLSEEENTDVVTLYTPAKTLYQEDAVIFWPSPHYKSDVFSLSNQLTPLRDKHRHGYQNGITESKKLNKSESEWTVHNGHLFHAQSIIPPTLCISNTTSTDSVYERINKVNENVNWSNLSLAK